MTPDDRARAILATLNKDEALRREAMSIFIGSALERPVASWIDVEAFVNMFANAVTEERVEREVTRHLSGAWERHMARVEAAEETLGDMASKEQHQAWITLLSEATRPELGWLQELIEPRLVGELMAPVFRDFLLSFVKQLPGLNGDKGLLGTASSLIPSLGGGFAGKLKSSVESRTEKLKDALGVERRIQDAVDEFSLGAGERFRSALRERLQSDEGNALATKIAETAVERGYSVKVSEIMKDLSVLPREKGYALIPALAEHNAKRGFVRAVAIGEIKAALANYAGRSLDDLLNEWGIRDEVIAHAENASEAWIADFAKEEKTAAFLSKLIQRSEN